MNVIVIKTVNKDQVVDITERVEEELNESKTTNGICILFVQHTTCALTTADLDPGTDEDMLEAFQKMIPQIQFRHPHDPEHTPDHILSSIIGPSLIIPFENKKLQLGTWQRIVLIEFDGPRERKITISFHP